MEPITRKYTKSDAELMSFTSSFISVLTNSLPDLASYGLTSAKITALETLGNQFEEFLPDAFYVSEISLAVIERNAKRLEIADLIQSLMVRIENTIQHKLLKYKNHQAAALKKRSNEEFLNDTRYFTKILASDLTALAGEGVEQAHIDALTAAAQTLENLINDVSEKTADRAEQAQKRIELGNSVYDLVRKYAAYGKDKYENNPAKYNQFVLYANDNAPQNSPDAPAIEVIEGMAHVVFAQNVGMMRLYRKFAEGDEFEEVYSGANQPVAVGEGYPVMYLEAQGHNAAGWGAKGAKVIYGIPPSATNAGYHDDRLKWDVDDSVESVEIEVSYDNGVTYQEVATVVGAKFYIWTPPSGLVFFRIRTVRAGQRSPWVVFSAVIP